MTEILSLGRNLDPKRVIDTQKKFNHSFSRFELKISFHSWLPGISFSSDFLLRGCRFGFSRFFQMLLPW